MKAKLSKKKKDTEARIKAADAIRFKKFQAIFSQRTVDLGMFELRVLGLVPVF